MISLDDTNGVTEIFSGNIFSIAQDADGYFRILLPWGNVFILEQSSFYDFICDLKDFLDTKGNEILLNNEI